MNDIDPKADARHESFELDKRLAKNKQNETAVG
jgi:hypothetical protein